MLDRALQIWIYLLIFGDAAFALLWAIVWFSQFRRPKRVTIKLLCRNLFYMTTSIIGWYLLSARLLAGWLVLFITTVMLALSTVAAELIGRALSRRRENSRAT
jgi:hypothetical protein